MNNLTKVEMLLKEGNNVRINPIGTSMWPLFVERDDAAVIKPYVHRKYRIKRNDVCVYKRNSGQLIIHRVYKVKNDAVYFVGDHQTEIEGPLPVECIIGVMIAFVRKGREYSVSNPIYVLLSCIWLFIRPFRLKIIKIGSKIKNIIN